MSRFFKSAAFPILIVIVLAFFASKLIQNADSGAGDRRSTVPDPARQRRRQRRDHCGRRTTPSRSRSKGPEKKRYTTGWVQGDAGAQLINKLRVASS